ncbi:hypothetical protein C8F04DRAFT_118492 [Mycena alexandri]|uniref:PLAC8 family protein n=1 Tax=Mycena alexandri TaxID=1745969 RepID=A0AAD6SE40_9AGAR|nr:hypothetical protein C8F04DRAFT_118492 [Mycena alexandri]
MCWLATDERAMSAILLGLPLTGDAVASPPKPKRIDGGKSSYGSQMDIVSVGSACLPAGVHCACLRQAGNAISRLCWANFCCPECGNADLQKTKERDTSYPLDAVCRSTALSPKRATSVSPDAS